MNNLEKAFDKTYADRVLSDIDEQPHEFSLAFEKRMGRLIKTHCGNTITASGAIYPRLIIKYATIAALLAVLATSVR